MTLQRENIHSPDTQNITVRAHDKRRFWQPFRNEGGGAICEQRKQTDRWSRGPQSWTGPLAGLQEGAAPCLRKFYTSWV